MPVEIKPLLAALDKLEAAQAGAAANALSQFGHHLVGQSQLYTPRETGFLQNSVFVSEPVIGVDSIEVTVGHNARYAAAVHERLDLHHKEGQAKYLERAVRENEPKLAPFVAKKLQEAVGNG